MDIAGILVRTLVCFFIVFATWNPTGYNFIWWATHSAWATAPEIAAGGAMLLALQVLFVRIAWLSLGPDGITAAVGILSAGALALNQFDVVDLTQPLALEYALLAGIALLLAIGTVWSLLKRRIVGQSNYLYGP